jgi:nitrite reductase/ring-hydroxylating ferredoxin subunit
VLAAIPTAVTGLADWADTGDDTRRIGNVHAVLNLTATVLFGLSWLARRRRHHARGVALSLAGTTVVTAGAALGGHLVYRTGTGVDWTAFDEPPRDWTAPQDPPRPLAAGTSVLAVGANKVLATRLETGTWAGIDARCTHRGGPLDEGEIEDGCVTCPWHHSRFRLDDGAVVHGPATAPQPRYDVREQDGALTVRAASDDPSPS